MDLLALYSSVRRHLVIVGVVIVLTALGDAYVLFGTPPAYESKASYVLVNPPSPPTENEIARDPALGKLNTDNPYLRMPTPSVVVDVLAQRMTGENVRRELVARGADTGYAVAPTNALGAGLVVDITGTGTSARQARRTVDLVAARMAVELRDMQKVNGADDRFLIRALPVSAPTAPVQKVTGTLRSLIAVSVAGLIGLFAAISVAEAVRVRRGARTIDAAQVHQRKPSFDGAHLDAGVQR